MTTLPRFDSINLGDSSVPADAQEQFARLAAAAGEQEPWTTPEQIPVGHLYSEDIYGDIDLHDGSDENPFISAVSKCDA